MLRIRVEASQDGDGWLVSAGVSAASGPPVPVVAPYRMDAVVTGTGRRLPRPPVDRQPAPGEQHAPLCGGDSGAAVELLARLAERIPEPGDVVSYGRWLFESLLAPAWRAIASDPQFDQVPMELALLWEPTSPLHRMVWEAMHDGRAPLVSHPDRVVAITRLVHTESPAPEPISVMPRVLFATGAPLADPTIRPGAMFMGLLKALDASGRCRSKAILGASLRDIETACRGFAPHLVHVVAHGELTGDGTGTVLLRGEGGESPADARALFDAVTAGASNPLAVVISACNSGGGGVADDPTDVGPLAAQLVAAGMPVVSAVAGEIGERACRYYTRRLAESLHAGEPIVAAAAHGRRAAMMGAGNQSDDLDWALPALFLSDQVDPGRPLIDRAGAERVVELADRLTLRKQPIFVGRHDILSVADTLVEDGPGIRVAAVTFEQDGEGFGATRLLREIGWRVIRDGHVPVLLGPFSPTLSPAPHTLRDLLATVATAIVNVLEKFNLPIFVPHALWLELGPAEMATLHATLDDPSIPRSVATTSVRQALQRMAANPIPLQDAAAVRGLLVEDLHHLAAAVRAWGPPFGAHTRPVLLCDNVHNWADPGTFAAPDRMTALTGLLAMLDGSGLGNQDGSVPVVLSGSATTAAGPALRAWSEDANPWLGVMSLGDMTAEEALVGFQWVLLHPWSSPNGHHQDRAFTYTPRPQRRTEWELALAQVPRVPESVKETLYLMARVGCAQDWLARNDDENDWRAYAAANGLG